MNSKVMSFKVPEDLAEKVDEAVEEDDFLSRGEYLRHVLRNALLSRELTEETDNGSTGYIKEIKGEPVEE